MIGIYKITSPSNKVYIGQSKNIETRFKHYLGDYKSNSSQTRLYNSFKKYNLKNHIFEIIEECEIFYLNIRERYWQDFYHVLGDKGLNCILTETDTKYRVMSEETKKKISIFNKGKISGDKNPNYGKFGILNPFYGRNHTEETKKILSLKNSGKNSPFFQKKRPEHSLKMSGINHFNYGKKSPKTSEMNKLRIGLKSPRLKIYLDIYTGVFYYGLNDLSNCFDIKIQTIRYKLRTNKMINIISI